jgi:hypothetical protein
MPIEVESPEELGYGAIDCNLAESSFRDQRLSDPGHWFEQDRRYLRLGSGWPTTDELRRGLVNLSDAADAAS